MIRHHFRTALRALRRDRSHALLGGLSLSVAIAACILIALFVRDELSYDRGVPNADRISVLAEERVRDGDTTQVAFTVEALAGALMESLPEVEAATTTMNGAQEIRILGRSEMALETLFADSFFVDVFAYPFLAGDPTSALDAPDGLVLTESAAQRVFGSPRPMGETLDLAVGPDTLTVTVRGVLANLPEPSSQSFEAIVPLRGYWTANPYVSTGWGGAMYRAYALRQPGVTPEALEASMNPIGPDPDQVYTQVPLLKYRLSDLSFAEGFGASPRFIQLFVWIGLLILGLGAINTINLSVARGERRAREVGVRKVLGSSRGSLIRQYLTESTVLAVVAGLAGLALAALALPWFNEAFLRTLSLDSLDAPFLVGLAICVVFVGVVAGLYPAVYLSRFTPDRVLRGTASVGDHGGAFLSRTWLRRGLVMVQVGAAVLLLVGTAVMLRQLDYALTAPLGFEPENVAVIPITDAQLVGQPDVVAAAFLQSPDVEAVAGAGAYPTNYWHTSTGSLDPDQPDLEVSWKQVLAGPGYDLALGLDVVAGRWPKADRPDDLVRGVVLNEAMVSELGWPGAEAAIGRQVTGMIEGIVVGVVGDFHYTSFREPMGPVVMAPARLEPWQVERGETSIQYYQAIVRFADGRAEAGIADVKAAYAELAPGAVFAPIWLEEAVDELYAADTRLAGIFAVFAALAVLIAGLGLIGLAAYTAERRTKEIGIRRVLGATVAQVVGLLSREYVLVALVGAAVAVPLATIAAHRWLESFVYRTTLGAGTITLTVAAAIAFVMLTVGVLAARAALTDPMRALRSD